MGPTDSLEGGGSQTKEKEVKCSLQWQERGSWMSNGERGQICVTCIMGTGRVGEERRRDKRGLLGTVVQLIALFKDAQPMGQVSAESQLMLYSKAVCLGQEWVLLRGRAFCYLAQRCQMR